VTRRLVQELRLRFNDFPITFVPRSSLGNLGIRDDQRKLLEQVLAALERYSEQRYQLAHTTYHHLASALPAYFLERRMISVVCCPNGVIVRYEKQDCEGVVGSWSNKTIRDITPLVSENSVYLLDEGGRLPDDFSAPSLTLCSRAPDGSRKDMLSIPFVVSAHISGELSMPQQPLSLACFAWNSMRVRSGGARTMACLS
jgi:hypothetical protein